MKNHSDKLKQSKTKGDDDKSSLLGRVLGPKPTKEQGASIFVPDANLSPLQQALANGEAPQSEAEALATGRPPTDVVAPPVDRKARAALVVLTILLAAGAAMLFGILPNPLATSDTASATATANVQFDEDKRATFAITGAGLSQHVLDNGGFLAPELVRTDLGWEGALPDVLSVLATTNPDDEVEHVLLRFSAASATPRGLVELLTAGVYLGDPAVLAELVDDASRAPTGSVVSSAAMDVHVVADGSDRVLVIVPPGSAAPAELN